MRSSYHCCTYERRENTCILIHFILSLQSAACKYSIDWLQSVESVPETQVISNYHSMKQQGMHFSTDLYLNCSLTSVISYQVIIQKYDIADKN